MDKPQMIEHLHEAVNYTVYDTKWIPLSAKFVVLGSKPNSQGILDIYELNQEKLEKVKSVTKKSAFKCGTFGASSMRNRHLAVGDFEGRLQVLDLERPDMAVYNVKAHTGIINCIDAIGGTQLDCGAPEIVTGSRDGAVRVWDIRQGQEPVVDISPPPQMGDGINNSASTRRDCWAVAFGNTYNEQERIVAAGYDNGDLKLFDLRALAVRWETTLKNGVCGLEFDRRDIIMNKMAVTTLEGGLLVFDMRTQHPTKGFSWTEERNAGRSVGSNGIIQGPKATVWTVRHLPQNRDVFLTGSGTGSIRLWKYDYPDRRVIENSDGAKEGVAGKLQMVSAVTLSSQPVHSFDWHPDKLGLAVAGAFDQSVRVLITTKLNTL
ncbi:dynein axonemal assembly factor 10 [Drosophila sulfurigaster albostrigata]|uniref:dynein axonemal assembly factor 10 n=1 Tax=Drosophila sulfurigaster albostrigata TaxID=89887 RepID=UPI002D21A79E|nr:dynein axonemal assembly factor 10 [Drosophila sulfurigaster albostrigata]